MSQSHRVIEGLTLHDNGAIGLGSFTAPQDAELPAVQLGDWTLSKLTGDGKPLTASRGDGRRIRFEYRSGSWWEAATESLPPSRPAQPKRHAAEAASKAELKRLAAMPPELFHVRQVVMSHLPANRYVQGGLNPMEPYREGDVELDPSGYVTLGVEAFPPEVEIPFYRFGQSMAYREQRGRVLVVASPAGVRWYEARPYCWTDGDEWKRASVYKGNYYIGERLERGVPSPFARALAFLGLVSERAGWGLPRKCFAYEPLIIADDGIVFVSIMDEDVPEYLNRHRTSKVVSMSLEFPEGWCRGAATYLGQYVVFQPNQPFSYSAKFIQQGEQDAELREWRVERPAPASDIYLFKAEERGDISRVYRLIFTVTPERVLIFTSDAWDWYKLHPVHGSLSSPPQLEGGSAKRLG